MPRSRENGESRARKKTKSRHNFKVRARTKGQQRYIDSINQNVVTLCSGYAGTGKTLIAIGMALSLVHSDQSPFTHIIVVRPAVEACGEKIGYLPGGLADKMRPLIEPIIDNLRFFVKDQGYIGSLLEPTTNFGAPLIEVIPMAYLRGRTFNNCVVVFDEAQNASPQQMKLFLTRIGENTKVVIEGDVTQSDTFKKREENGLFDAMKRLHDVDNVGVVCLEASDIQRSSIIAPILEKYQDVDGI